MCSGGRLLRAAQQPLRVAEELRGIRDFFVVALQFLGDVSKVGHGLLELLLRRGFPRSSRGRLVRLSGGKDARAEDGDPAGKS